MLTTACNQSAAPDNRRIYNNEQVNQDPQVGNHPQVYDRSNGRINNTDPNAENHGNHILSNPGPNPAIRGGRVEGGDGDQHPQAEADRIAQAAASVPGVKRATVIINGETAYIGLQFDRVMRDQSRLAYVKDQVRTRVQQKMPRYRVRLTSDSRLFSMIQDIRDGIRSGTPANNYRTNFIDIDSRINQMNRSVH